MTWFARRSDLNGCMNHRHAHAVLAKGAVAALMLLAIIGDAGVGASSSTPLRPLLIVKVPSTNVLYILGNVGCSTAACLHLVRTTTSFSSEVAVTLPPVSKVRGIASGSLGQVAFANSSDGYALDEVDGVTDLYVTRDGAKSWHRQTFARHDVVTRIVTTATSVILVAMQCSKQTNGDTGCSHYELLQSGLSGQHWRSSLVPNGSVTPWGFFGNPTAFATTVWLSEQFHHSLLLTSHNGGVTYATRRVADLISVAGCDLTATSLTTLWAECPTGMFASLFFSSDGGSTWTSLLGTHGLAFAGTGGGAFDPVSATLAYIDVGQVVKSGNIYRVTNHGRTVRSVGNLKCPNMLSLDFFNERDGLGVCSDYSRTYFVRSSDGGAHWHRFELR